jgi:hypothetical protein
MPPHDIFAGLRTSPDDAEPFLTRVRKVIVDLPPTEGALIDEAIGETIWGRMDSPSSFTMARSEVPPSEPMEPLIPTTTGGRRRKPCSGMARMMRNISASASCCTFTTTRGSGDMRRIYTSLRASNGRAAIPGGCRRPGVSHIRPSDSRATEPSRSPSPVRRFLRISWSSTHTIEANDGRPSFSLTRTR